MSKNEQQQTPKTIVGAFIFNARDELLLIRSSKWNNKYVCPGGGVELGETREEALHREVKEETGLAISDVELIRVRDAVDLGDSYQKANKHLVFHNYRAKTKGEKVRLNEEADDYQWLKPEEWLGRDDVEPYTRETIEALVAGRDDYEGLYRRALADYQNLQKRTAEEKSDFAKYANEQLLISLLPVFDNLKISIKHFDENKDTNAWLEGIKFVVKQFRDVLEELGVQEIKTVGEKFDHYTMEAVEGEGDTVVQEVTPGYKFQGKVIVPAKVVVGTHNS
jgi:nucleoside triphosphatase